MFSKIAHSLINVGVAYWVASLSVIRGDVNLESLKDLYNQWEWKVLCIAVFYFGCNMLFEAIFGKCLGMCLFSIFVRKTRYAVKRSFRQKLLYISLYTVSFSTVVISLKLFLINLVLLQIPCFLIKKNTLHGYLGGMKTVYEEHASNPAS